MLPQDRRVKEVRIFIKRQKYTLPIVPVEKHKYSVGFCRTAIISFAIFLVNIKTP